MRFAVTSMDRISFQAEAFFDVIEEAKPLLQRHWEEIALDKASVPLDPDWDRYREFDKKNGLSVVTARVNGELVGYCCMILSMGLHYKTTPEAIMDIFWLAPEVRGRMGGVRLFRAVEKELQRLGIRRVNVGSKLHKDVSRLFLALGYQPIEMWFSKLLEAP
ncbi:MAG TPA: GNAT family N-acetyltransferase [Stellaceae bacterium]